MSVPIYLKILRCITIFLARDEKEESNSDSNKTYIKKSFPNNGSQYIMHNNYDYMCAVSTYLFWNRTTGMYFIQSTDRISHILHFINVWMEDSVHESNGRWFERILFWEINTHFPHSSLIWCCKHTFTSFYKTDRKKLLNNDWYNVHFNLTLYLLYLKWTCPSFRLGISYCL